jgi:hypothetical protein
MTGQTDSSGRVSAMSALLRSQLTASLAAPRRPYSRRLASEAQATLTLMLIVARNIEDEFPRNAERLRRRAEYLAAALQANGY